MMPDNRKKLCACGQKMAICSHCLEWVCRAPGHAVHDCLGPPAKSNPEGPDGAQERRT